MLTFQVASSSDLEHPRKREDCLSSEPRSGEGEFRSAGCARAEGGRSAPITVISGPFFAEATVTPNPLSIEATAKRVNRADG
ncbi:hypothetical protein [Pseudohongiella spirulinae]|uniref:Uncharacterized protein n=1 Tax=Pseudohongiella spirulinae TaxID=1249552 RepID=A0A0S2KDU3_9GAMM|nr:hypothetical protein [Pseudohongiella spirulinae]ALO46480.1 hypothetical protein PS2015_1831 [Pseudohongiella spirulinae]